MQRHDMIDTMRGLGLKGMAAAFDEAVDGGGNFVTGVIVDGLFSADLGGGLQAIVRPFLQRLPARGGAEAGGTRDQPDQGGQHGGRKARFHGRPRSSTLRDNVSGLRRSAREPESDAATMRA